MKHKTNNWSSLSQYHDDITLNYDVITDTGCCISCSKNIIMMPNVVKKYVQFHLMVWLLKILPFLQHMNVLWLLTQNYSNCYITGTDWFQRSTKKFANSYKFFANFYLKEHFYHKKRYQFVFKTLTFVCDVINKITTFKQEPAAACFFSWTRCFYPGRTPLATWTYPRWRSWVPTTRWRGWGKGFTGVWRRFGAQRWALTMFVWFYCLIELLN